MSMMDQCICHQRCIHIICHVQSVNHIALTVTLPLISSSPEEVCYETVPAILGLARAMKGTDEYRAKAFREICGLEEEGEEGGGGKEEKFGFKDEDVVKLKNMVSKR